MPIQFTCPHCDAKTEVSDQYAGQTGPCKQCGETIVIPRPEVSTAPASKSNNTFVIAAAIGIVMLIGGVMIVVVLVALLFPAVSTSREAARRMSCENNLKQIGLAMHSYHSTYRTFPPAYLPDEDGQPMHSWRVLLLPFLNQQSLYDQYDFDLPWDSPDNQALASQISDIFHCPSDNIADHEATSYVVVVGLETAFPGAQTVSISDITDGTSDTILVTEVASSPIHWMEPKDIPIEEFWEQTSFHPNGYNVSLADGSVRFMSDDTSPDQLNALTTIAAGDDSSTLDDF